MEKNIDITWFFVLLFSKKFIQFECFLDDYKCCIIANTNFGRNFVLRFTL